MSRALHVGSFRAVGAGLVATLAAAAVAAGVAFARNPTGLSLVLLFALIAGCMLSSALLRMLRIRLVELQEARAAILQREAELLPLPGTSTSGSVGSVANEVNNLLTVILGFSGLALKNMAEDDPNRGFVSEIWMAGDRGKDLAHWLARGFRCAAASADRAATAPAVRPPPAPDPRRPGDGPRRARGAEALLAVAERP